MAEKCGAAEATGYLMPEKQARSSIAASCVSRVARGVANLWKNSICMASLMEDKLAMPFLAVGIDVMASA